MNSNRKNIVGEKRMDFSERIFHMHRHLNDQHREFVLSRQLLRSATSVGAMVQEAQQAESLADFRHKFSIAQKEMNESLYWIDLLFRVKCISQNEHASIQSDAKELIRLITAIIKTTKLKEKQGR